MKAAAALALLVVIAGNARANNPCSHMDRTAVRFRGVVRDIETGYGSFDVTLSVARVETKTDAMKSGERLTFTVHSPTMTFADTDLLGKSYDLMTVAVTCDDDNRFDDLWRTNDIVEDLDGFVEVGHTYRSTANGRVLNGLRLPYHHDGGLGWTNEELLPDDERERTVVFRIDRASVTYYGDRTWMTIYTATIVKVE